MGVQRQILCSDGLKAEAFLIWVVKLKSPVEAFPFMKLNKPH